MLRVLRKSLSILSLLLALATAVLWFRSRTNIDGFPIFNQYYAPANHFIVKGIWFQTCRGRLWIQVSHSDVDLALDKAQAELFHRQAVLGWSANFQTQSGAHVGANYPFISNSIAGFGFHNIPPGSCGRLKSLSHYGWFYSFVFSPA